MGHYFTMAAMGVMVFFLMNNASINRKESTSAENSYGYAKAQIAHVLTTSATEIARAALENTGAGNVTGTFAGGWYSCTSVQAGDTTRLIATTIYDDSTTMLTTTLLRQPKPFPETKACLALSVDPIPSGFMASGYKLSIDARNFDSTGNSVIDNGTVAGISVINKSDSATANGWLGSTNWFFNLFFNNKTVTISTTGKAIQVYPQLPAPASFTSEFALDADSNFTPTSMLTGTRSWGTATAPQIIHISGDGVKAATLDGTIEGWGVLDLSGNIVIRGSFKWHGLVITHDSPSLDLSSATVTPLIVGTMLMDKPPAGATAIKGNISLRYSASAINVAKSIRKLQSYIVLASY